MLALLDLAARTGTPAPLDVAFAALVARLAGNASDEIVLAACLASAAIGEGNLCADLRRIAGTTPFRLPDDSPLAAPRAPSLEPWRTALRACPVVGKPGERRPLVLDESDRLYLHRYWAYEHEIADELRRRATAPAPEIDRALLQEGLDRIFGREAATEAPREVEALTGPRDEDASRDQRVATATAVSRHLCVVSGGPGTGKTTTVVRILALLIEQARAAQARDGGERPSQLRVHLAAPTGKAAARLQEAVRQAKAELRDKLDGGTLDAIPETASTIHRLLGPRLHSVYFRHDRSNPLPVDALVIDESSMVDVALMAKLLRALPPDARLVLVGDKDQLASVEAGAVFGDVCGPADDAYDTGSSSTPGEPLRGAVVLLRHSYRFGRGSGIGALARAVRDGDTDAALAILDDERFPDVSWHAVDSRHELHARLRQSAASSYEPYSTLARSGAPADAIFAAFGRYRILCAVRAGDAGVSRVNEVVADALDGSGAIDRRGDWYTGRPVMITRNDYDLRLFNGDVGITLPDASGHLRVHFEDSGEKERLLPPIRLPEHETVFAMTVHKSQGSEFDSVLLVLPPEGSRILGRELLYTGITRARTRLEIWSPRESLREAITTPLARASGLRDALWSG